MVDLVIWKAKHFRFNEFTKVLAVDCAYHFEKVQFFQEANKVVPCIDSWRGLWKSRDAGDCGKPIWKPTEAH